MSQTQTPTAYSSDPRLAQPSSYSRQECMDVINDFLRYLTERVPCLDSSWIMHPPVDGWSNITPDRFKPLNKTAEVIQLLAHLPYIHVPDQESPYAPHYSWPAIKRDTHFFDFRGEAFQSALKEAAQKGNTEPLSKGYGFQQPFIDVPPWVVCLTTGLKNGDFLLLDTSDGTVTKFVCVDAYKEPDYAMDDPRAWRDECTVHTRPIREYFEELKEEFENFVWLAYFHYRRPTILFPGDSPAVAEHLEKTYRKYGWPDDFERDACRQALIDWDAQENP